MKINYPKTMQQFTSMQSPVGYLRIDGDDGGITAVNFVEEDPGQSEYVPDCLKTCRLQLQEYFDGKRKVFDLPLKPQGTDFQGQVWNALLGIPFGSVRSYRDIAYALKNAKAIRAVGTANGQNRISIIIPCHRVIGTSGDLTGYAGGLWRKKWLLEHEQSIDYGKQGSLF